MLIIPVLDIKDGLVVRARMGLRHTYRPIETPLSRTADAGEVAEGLRGIYPFPTFYIADLDSIEGGGGTAGAAGLLSGLKPPPEIWIDAGFASAEGIRQVLDMERVSPVLGSETQADARLLRTFNHDPRLILSLDFRGDAFLGPSEILSAPDLWPSRVIVMTLGRVGAGSGPDFDRLEMITNLAGKRDVIAAGGIRHAEDIKKLRRMGIAGALVATSLHSGALTGEAIAGLMT